jgi:hypothetical protein
MLAIDRWSPETEGAPDECLLVADLHYDLRKVDWVVDTPAYVDVVALAGVGSAWDADGTERRVSAVSRGWGDVRC